ncbi:MAG: threonyl-tRNA synthetase / Ser-tRNA(Thr) hydrolase [Deltaproteobacteria bacterium]|nr:threonyl-tRNA synthetase / Ser-tRNA(Thr) hydrolase [Deltaproteobacteria bacterium]
MEKIEIKIQGGKTQAFPRGILPRDILKEMPGNSGKEKVISAKFSGSPWDLQTPLNQDGELEWVTLDSAEGLETLRHSTSHVMAQAVKSLFPEAKITIGPAIKEGFYYDFDLDHRFSPDDFPRIEEKMQEIISQDLPISRRIMGREEAIRYFQDRGEPFKAELIAELPDATLSLYQQGEFVDLCRGPHLPSTGRIPAFKLTSLAGAYWRGDERNKMLQRIYGTAFPTKEALEKHLHLLEEAKRRDHRKLGRELDLFSINDEAGAGLVIYHPKGALLRMLLEDFEKTEHLKRGYQIVIGPQILKLDLWKRSGHYDNYRDKMYFTEVEGQEYGLKPMNCLAHMLIYKSKIRSYRDLPLRYFELGTVHRHEKSGELHGLLRVRGFTQDDAHILCTPEQLNGEIKGILDFVRDVMKIFDFPYDLEISTRPETGSIGSDEDWDRATRALRKALEESGLSFQINEGEGAFYGPKIDVKLKDALGREWQCATIQVDFAMPERFELSYIGADGEKHRPVMVHRVILGAMERFIGVLIEHFAGAFPIWLAPVQVILLTVTDPQTPYAQNVYQRLLEAGIRVEKDFRNEKLGLKIREAELQKIPYMVVLGDREVKQNLLSPRARSGKTLAAMPVEEFVNIIRGECRIIH